MSRRAGGRGRGRSNFPRAPGRSAIRRTIQKACAGLAAIGLLPGTPVRIAGEGGLWRARSVAIEGMATRVELVPVGAAPVPYPATSGAIVAPRDVLVGETRLVVAELPPIDDAILTAPRISVMACGTQAGWRGAALLYSIDDGASWIAAGGVAAPSVLGTVVVPPGDGPATLADSVNTLVVELLCDDLTLADADRDGLAQGRNIALIGEEVVQFAHALPLGAGRWRLSGLTRGLRGTDWASAGHQAGAAFALIDPGAVVTIEPGVSAIGRSIRLLATGVGDVAGPVAATAVVTGASVVPPAPVHLVAETAADGWRLGWTRRSRAGWAWRDGIDAPLVEEREAYVVTVTPPAAPPQDHAVASASLVLSTPPPPGSRVAVRQIGTVGASRAAVIVIPGETA